VSRTRIVDVCYSRHRKSEETHIWQVPTTTSIPYPSIRLRIPKMGNSQSSPITPGAKHAQVPTTRSNTRTTYKTFQLLKHEHNAIITLLTALERDHADLKDRFKTDIQKLTETCEIQRVRSGNALVLADTKYLCGKERDRLAAEFGKKADELRVLLDTLEVRKKGLWSRMRSAVKAATEEEKAGWLLEGCDDNGNGGPGEEI
jgi:hypothetical protein